MSSKFFCLPLAISTLLLSAEAFSAVYCGVVNGVQVWDELVPSDCTKALRQMQLSKEHTQSAQKGQRIEKSYGTPSSKTVENAVTSIGDYLQKGADDRAEAERAARAKMYADDDEKKRILIAQLSNHILADYPEVRIKKADCKSTRPGLGVFDAPKFNSAALDKEFDSIYKITLPQMYGDIKKKGKGKFISEMKVNLAKAQGLAYDSFQEAITISSEVSVKHIQAGDLFPIDCASGRNNANTCKYIYGRYMSDYLTTLIALAEKCVK